MAWTGPPSGAAGTINFGITSIVEGITTGLITFRLKATAFSLHYETLCQKDDYPTQEAGFIIQRYESASRLVFATRGVNPNSGSGPLETRVISSITDVETLGWILVGAWADVDGPKIAIWVNGTKDTLADCGNAFGSSGHPLYCSVKNTGVNIAELAIWSDITEAQADAFMASMRSGNLTALQMPKAPALYVPMRADLGESSERNLFAATPTGTLTGVTAAEHPNLVYPIGRGRGYNTITTSKIDLARPIWGRTRRQPVHAITW